MSALSLTVPARQGQTTAKSRFQAGASDSLNGVAGFSSPNPEAHKSRAIPAAFLCQYGSPYNGRAVREAARLAGPQAGLLTRTVPLTRLAAGKRSYKPHPEDTIMAINATSTGAIRPKNTQTRLHADGSTDTITWVREATVIKRIRRKLAERNHRLVITRLGTQARVELGEYAVLNDQGEVLDKDCNLADLARFIGVLAPEEMIDPRVDKGWRFCVARREQVEIDGKKYLHNKPLTRGYSTEEKARQAAAHIQDRTGLVLVSWDANPVRESRHGE